MKLQNTPAEITALVAALKPLRVKLFSPESCDPKYNAQRNLSGRTHYAEDDTLRFFHARINSAGPVADSQGLLFRITESVSLDMHNRERGTRCVVFDIFGTTVTRPTLEETFRTSAAAQKACNAIPFDLVAHYREAVKSKLHYAEDEAKRTLEAAQNIEAVSVVSEVLAER